MFSKRLLSFNSGIIFLVLALGTVGCKCTQCYYPMETCSWEEEVVYVPVAYPSKPKHEAIKQTTREPEIIKAKKKEPEPVEPEEPTLKIKREPREPRPYGLVIPFTEQCLDENENDLSLYKTDGWGEISPWIYVDSQTMSKSNYDYKSTPIKSTPIRSTPINQGTQPKKTIKQAPKKDAKHPYKPEYKKSVKIFKRKDDNPYYKEP